VFSGIELQEEYYVVGLFPISSGSPFEHQLRKD